MNVLPLVLVLFAVYGQSRRIGKRKPQITPLAGNEEEIIERGLILNADQIADMNKAFSHMREEDNYDPLTHRLVREEEERMLVAGLHLDKRNSAHNDQSAAPHLPLSSGLLSSVRRPNPPPVPASVGDAKSGFFTEDLIAKVLPTPTHSFTVEVNKRHSLVEVMHTTESEDSIKETGISTGPDETALTYKSIAAMLSSAKTQVSNVTEASTTVSAKLTENQSIPPIKDRSKSSQALKTQEQNVTTAEKSNIKTVIRRMKENTKNTMHFPYFLDNYCPPECACYGRVVQCSDKGVDRVPYGIPYNSRYILLMNNHIDHIQLDFLSEYISMEFLALTNNRLTDGAIEGAFEGVPALKRLYLDSNQLQSVPIDLPMSLEELRLDNNQVELMSEVAWTHCPGLLILSMKNNSLGFGNASNSLPKAVMSPLCKLQILNLDHNQLTSVPLGLPLSLKELYLKGNRIEEFRNGTFNGKSELVVLDLSKNRLTNKGLFKDTLLNATHLESLNLEGNRLKQIPQHLPLSLKTLNLEDNLITTIRKMSFGILKNLEHLSLARNNIFKVAVGAFRKLPLLHMLDLGHNALRQVPRQLPPSLHSVGLTHNRIGAVPRDAFCWGNNTGLSGLVRVQLQNNVIDMSKIDTHAFRCLRGFQVVHLY
ncbi:unnamed protein product [Knipowitschia caucasica]